MNSNPSEETVAQFTEITNVDHLSAISYLRVDPPSDAVSILTAANMRAIGTRK